MHICENCNTPFEKSSDINSIRFCCEHCRRVYIGKHSSHKRIANGTFISGFTYARNNGNHRAINLKKSYGYWNCQYCGEIFQTKAKLYNHRHEKHPDTFYNHQIWNKGLTEETSEIVKKWANNLRESYRTGRLKPKPCSKETREKLSKVATQHLESISLTNHGWCKNIKWYSCKNINGDEYLCQGSWEYNVAVHLNELHILWIRRKSINYIREGIIKTYTPDFYLPDTDEYIEVKGRYGNGDKEKMKLVMESNPSLKLIFIDAYHYKDFIKGKISLDRSILKLWY